MKHSISTGYRLFERKKETNWQYQLISWSQPRCRLCGRFLSKRQWMYCINCGNLIRHQIQNVTRKNSRETIKKIVKIPIPRKVWRMLDYGVG